ncbi:hypothetical protein MLD52_17180 [Puniceicoccaceae bacterium K14]|nr:hypothetical protein [Puniceicoccaceae bacterium K14]
MTTLGIELSDVGISCVQLKEDGNSASVKLGVQSDHFPAYALAANGTYVFGAKAQSVSRIYPRRVCSEFLDNISFQTLKLDGAAGRITYSQLAHKFVGELVTRIRVHCDEIDRIIVAVPGNYLESDEKSEERLGLLLAILQDYDLPLAGIIDLAAASLYSDGLGTVPEGDSVFHVDLLLHATNITVFNKRAGLQRVYFSHQPQRGFAKMLERFSGALANRFLKHTAFDITEDRQIEQAFHAQTNDMLFNLGQIEEASIEVTTKDISRHMSITRDSVSLDLAPQVKLLTQTLLRAINDFGRESSRVQIILSHRAAAVHGLKESIQAQDVGHVRELPVESAAFGAANLGKNWAVCENVETVRVETGIAQPNLMNDGSDEARFSLCSISLIKKGKSLAPSHIVCDGLAYELVEDGFIIGLGESERFHLVVDRHGLGEPGELARLVKKNERWVLVEKSSESVDVDSLSGVRAGDEIEVTIRGRRKKLLLIHCMQ